MSETRLLEFQDVSKTYHDKRVLNRLSFSLRKGEVLALLGPSGCGKTTILNIAAGLLKPSSGSVNFGTTNFGYVFQEPRLIPWKTVLDNVKFPLNRKDNHSDEKARKVLQQVDLQDAIHSFPKQLSGGMKQRVSIARALVCEPEIIFMDEPFSALDVSLKRGLQDDVIRLIQERGTAALYVTHDPEEAARLADRVFIFTKESSAKVKEMIPPITRNNRKSKDIQELKHALNSNILGEF